MQRERLDVRKVFAALRAAETHLKTIFGATAIHQSQSEEFEKGSREALSSGILNAANHDRLTLGQSKHNTSANQNKGTRLEGIQFESAGGVDPCSLFVVRRSSFVARCVSSLFVVFRCSPFVVRCSLCFVVW